MGRFKGRVKVISKGPSAPFVFLFLKFLKSCRLYKIIFLILKKASKNQPTPNWTHPGGKLRELGAESLTDAEPLSILISTGTKGKSAEDIARGNLDKYGSFRVMALSRKKKLDLRMLD